jgi:O-antigen/teichoic acid export membrane protein
MQRKFLVNIILFLFLNLLIKPFWIFGIDRTVQNMVGAEKYGIYFALFSFTIIFNALLDFGLVNYNSRNVAFSKDFLAGNFSRLFMLRILMGGFYFVFVCVAGLMAGYKGFELNLLVVLTINQFLAGFILYLRSNISGLLMFKTDSILSILDRLIMICCCSLLIWGNVTNKPFQIEWFAYTQTLSYLFAIAVSLPIVLQKASLRRPFIDFSYFKRILIEVFPYALLTIITAIHNRVDCVLLERMLPDTVGSQQAGIYASAYRLLDAAIIVSYIFSVLLLPYFSKLLGEKQSVVPLLKTSFTLIFIYGTTLALTAVFYSAELMNLLYNEHVEISAKVFMLLMPAIAPLSATYIFGTLLTANGNLKRLNAIAIIAFFINILANVFLIPKMYAVGAATACLVTQFFIIIAEIISTVKIFHFQWNKKYFSLHAIFFILSVFFAFLSTHLPFRWEINFLIMCIIIVFISYLTKLIQPKLIIALLKNK